MRKKWADLTVRTTPWRDTLCVYVCDIVECKHLSIVANERLSKVAFLRLNK